MITAVTLALARAFAPGEADIRRRPPRNPNAALLSTQLMWRVLLVAALMTAACIGVFVYAQQLGWSMELSRTLAVNTLVACEIAYLFSSRQINAPARFGLRDNPMVWGMIVLLSVLQLAFTHWAPLQRLFATQSLDVVGWGICLLAGAALLVVVEMEKWLRRRAGWPL
jgi:magnesium-transporting ATPase (P-type)